jgi:DNA-binding response OmpR family regulator
MGIKIDLILIDYRLGDMVGDSVARKLREHNGTKIILISAYELDADLIKELENSKIEYTSPISFCQFYTFKD